MICLSQRGNITLVNTTSLPRQVRVAHLVSHPIQYFATLYRTLARRPEIDLEVLFCAGKSLGEHFDSGFGRQITWDVPLVDGYKYHLSEPARNRYPSSGFDWRVDWSIIRQLARGRYDVIWMHGRMSLHAWFAMLYGRVTGTPVFLRDDQTLLTPRSLLKRILKRIILPMLYRHVIGLPVGKWNKEFFEHYGTGQVYPVCYAVENRDLQARHRELNSTRADLRAAFNVAGHEPLILFCGKIIGSKQPSLLLEAFAKVREQTRCSLVFVGDGELRAALEEQVRTGSIPDVHFAGFMNQTELPKAYASADLLVLPSKCGETWGMVVNEAMNFGLPIIVSDRVGCAGDLVCNGVNGLVFEAGNLEALVTCLGALVRSTELRNAYGRNSLKAVSGYSLERSASQVIDAFLSTLRRTEARQWRLEGQFHAELDLARGGGGASDETGG
jgi:glycosyltransferase involved in cell wall biosynthesis